jgi:hypothetical protein
MIRVSGLNYFDYDDDLRAVDLALALKLDELKSNGIDFGNNVSTILLNGSYEGGSYTYPFSFGYNGNVRAIKFDKIMSIGNFHGCLSLIQVDIGNPDAKNNIQIGDGAFADCEYLKQFNVTKESHIKSIGEKAFSGCTNLKSRSSINISNDNLTY